MSTTTTFARLKEHGACTEGYKKLAKHLGGVATYGKHTPINLLTILESNGLTDTLWSLRAVQEPERDRVERLLACDYAEHVLPIFEAWYTYGPLRPWAPKSLQAVTAARMRAR